MEFINSYINQLEKDSEKREEVYQSKYFKEYNYLYDCINGVVTNKQDTQNSIEKTIEEMHAKDVQKMLSCANIIKQEIQEIMNRQCDFSIKGAILLLSDGSIDGHGILVDGEAYVFFDLNAITRGIDKYNIKAFVFHEIIHAVHYGRNIEFYLKNHITTEEHYFKRMICEGIATYFTGKKTAEPAEDVYWLGYLNKSEVNIWTNKCEVMRKEIGGKLAESIEKNVLDMDLYSKLFSVINMNDMTSSRMAYYYGSKIIEELSTNHSFEEILQKNYLEIRKIVWNYFCATV
ncbi:MAG: hypothetical protein COA82_10935 [Alkaliphilus sp.]|nr:hypothetical protein [bacterium AH-315-L21]MBN4069708.1 hypothetical protein [bacterium AH-315-G05]MBN4074882.1 hypothetical protein [bacterium AH-315-E09]PHS30849.1 MAG: hypothetical protein COA82_10935 [Alkaliphilus sp.]